MDEKYKNTTYNIRSTKVCCGAQGDCKACPKSCGQKFTTYDWLEDIDNLASDTFEIQFKNTRKGFYKNVNNLNLSKGDVVVVEASPGHDVGIVSLCGGLVKKQIKKRGVDPARYEFKKIFRKARSNDIEKWQEAVALEHNTMIKSRQIAASLKLSMKIGDVEYQGDKTKAIFYYIADERVDFRELIKILAEQFRIRIEMKQIGARQEAGLLGGIGPCGRELCCSKWLSNFVSVTTGTARYQELSPNPQKLAGQCCKLKCCLNYELDVYVEAQKDLPKIHAPLELVDGKAFLIKTDVLKKTMFFSHGANGSSSITGLPVEKVREYLALNKKGIKIEKFENPEEEVKDKSKDFTNVVGEDSITRFDKSKKTNKPKHKPKKQQPNNEQKTKENKSEEQKNSTNADNEKSRVNKKKHFPKKRPTTHKPQNKE